MPLSDAPIRGPQGGLTWCRGSAARVAGPRQKVTGVISEDGQGSPSSVHSRAGLRGGTTGRLPRGPLAHLGCAPTRRLGRSAVPANGFLVVFRHTSAALGHSAKRRLCPGTVLVRCAAVPPDGFHMVLRHAPFRFRTFRFRTFRRGCSARERLPARRRDGTVEPPPRGSAAHRRDRRRTRRRGRVGPARLPARPLSDTTALRRRRFARLFTHLGSWHRDCPARGGPPVPPPAGTAPWRPHNPERSHVLSRTVSQARLALAGFTARSACGAGPHPAVRDRRKQRLATVLPPRRP